MFIGNWAPFCPFEYCFWLQEPSALPPHPSTPSVSIQTLPFFPTSSPHPILLEWTYNLLYGPEQFGEKNRTQQINKYVRTTCVKQDPTHHLPIKGEKKLKKKKQLTELKFVLLIWSASDKGASTYKCILCHTKKKIFLRSCMLYDAQES